ncbi:hypothetical protein K2173_003450 [Erythroxylum novogranatense]|uniref:Ubiquitin-like domain-containing protein n=1 Tax=Erythroxylum novogranatense TaxID=1862640 RepID=A0AAV8S8Y0_9ROSI|nr:hypothetical protein K2173_003450 [Erythroxylum novogranatense]
MENHDTTQSKPFQIFAKLLDGKTATLRFTGSEVIGKTVKQRIYEISGVPTHLQRLLSGGTQIGDRSVVSSPDSTIHLLLPLVGGKGGFGSLLRGAATKAGQKKTNNFDACRDMSGRRLRHVNAEKRLEDWKAEEEERRLEKMAEEFIKKKAKKGKKGVGDGAAQKYVEKYRQDSAKCAAKVEEAVREACANGKRRGKSIGNDGVEAKRLKIWMGKRKLAASDSEDSDGYSSDDAENEKSVVLNNGDQSDSNKEADGSSDSVSGEKSGSKEEIDRSSDPVSGEQSDLKKEGDGSSDSVAGEKQDMECSGGASCETTSEEETRVAVYECSKSHPHVETTPNEGDVVIEPEFQNENAAQSATATCCEVAASSVQNGEVIETSPVVTETNDFSDAKSELRDIAATPNSNNGNIDLEKRLDLIQFNSAADFEVYGMEGLKTQLQLYGLKCGGTLQERAARLFLLKSTPLEKLPKKLLAKK